MFKNLASMTSELRSRLKTSSSAVTDERIKDWLNDAQDNIATEMDPDHLIENQSFSTVVNQRKYLQKVEFNKLLGIVDTEQDLELDYKSEGQLEFWDPNRSDGGAPLFYTIFGLEWIAKQPSSTSQLIFSSTSSADITQKIRIRGLVNDCDFTELVSLNGTASRGTTESFSEIFTVALDNRTAGNISISTGTGFFLDSTFIVGTSTLSEPTTTSLLDTICAGSLANQYQPIFFYPIPSDVRTIRLRGIRRPRAMINDEDYPDFPEAYHELILIDATIRGHRDLFRPQLAEQVRVSEWIPFMEKLKKQMGDKRAKHSLVIRGRTPIVTGGRLPPEFGGI